MVSFPRLKRVSVQVIIIGVLFVAVLSEGTQIVSITSPGTPCVALIRKVYIPDATVRSTVRVYKAFTMDLGVTLLHGHSAVCLPASTTSMCSVVKGFAYGPQVSNSPSCRFRVSNCGTITINGADGLPVELMEFSVGVPEETF